mgnify:FL=1|tara:strand:+ start:44054 stop:44335 length:282 start_codon:yes stop_codon:yes gene_type:complete
MKTKSLYVLIALLALGITSAPASAGNKNAALTACKAHIAELYKDDLQKSKLKKTYQRGHHIEVNMKLKIAGESIKAMCLVSNDGEVTYSTDSE